MKSPEKIATEIALWGVENFSSQEIISVLQSADDLYFNDAESFLSDTEYDALRRYAQGVDPTNPYFLGVGSSVRGGKVKLPFPMGSLTQAYEGDISKWVKKHSLQNDLLVCTDKIDGVSVLLVFGNDGALQIAYSRGDGIEGADITRHIRKIKSVPVAFKPNVVVRAEAIISKENFNRVQPRAKTRSGDQYKNPRNMMAGIMNAEKNETLVYDYIDVFAYEIVRPSTLDKLEQITELQQANFAVPPYFTTHGKNLDDEYLTRKLQAQREDSFYEIDGLVIDVDANDRRQNSTPTKDTLNPEYARKFKVADTSNLAIAEVINVDWNISKDGYLKPRVQIKPVQLVGVTVQNATGFNAKFIAENGIGPGAKIKITRSGDVIPLILEVIAPAKEPQMPDQDAEWTSTGVDLVLKNAGDNATVKFEQLNDFFATLDCPHLREGNLQKIFDAGIETPEEVLNLTQHDIRDIIGSAVMAKKIFQGIREKLCNIPQYVLMGAHPAFGRGVGVRKMKRLFEAFKGDMIKCKSAVNIIAVDGFDVKTATKIANGFPKYYEFISKVNSGVIYLAQYEEPKTGNWTGEAVVFTGFRSKEMEQMIIDQGGTISSSVSSKTTLVVAEDPTSTSGKAGKARELGIKIISVEELKERLGL